MKTARKKFKAEESPMRIKREREGLKFIYNLLLQRKYIDDIFALG